MNDFSNYRNIISEYLLTGKKISSKILLILVDLTILKTSHGKITLVVTELEAIVKNAKSRIDDQTINSNVHGAIFIEGCITVSLSNEGIIIFRLREDSRTHMDALQSIISLLTKKSGGVHHVAIDSLNFAFKNIQLSPPSSPSKTALTHGNSIQFLARLRRQGMDVIFPPHLYDKILCCIFGSLQVFDHSLAHREIIDMVMTVKESGRVAELENVTKTKVRGILAVLKHAEMFDAHTDLTDPVRLKLAGHVVDFHDFRRKHDEYLKRFAAENFMSSESILWSDFVWPISIEARLTLIQSTSTFLSKLNKFFKRHLLSIDCAPTISVPAQLNDCLSSKEFDAEFQNLLQSPTGRVDEQKRFNSLDAFLGMESFQYSVEFPFKKIDLSAAAIEFTPQISCFRNHQETENSLSSKLSQDGNVIDTSFTINFESMVRGLFDNEVS